MQPEQGIADQYQRMFLQEVGDLAEITDLDQTVCPFGGSVLDLDDSSVERNSNIGQDDHP